MKVRYIYLQLRRLAVASNGASLLVMLRMFGENVRYNCNK